MQRFVLRGNIERYERQLGGTVGAATRRTLEILLMEARRQLSLLDCASFGSWPQHGHAHPHASGEAGQAFASSDAFAAFRILFEESEHPYLISDPGPGLLIVDANPAYCAATMTARADTAGKPLFDVFPDNPDEKMADGVVNLFHSIRIVCQTRQAHEMAVQRYDIRDPQGLFVERHWQPVNAPLFDESGAIKFILHHVEDVTAERARAANA